MTLDHALARLLPDVEPRPPVLRPVPSLLLPATRDGRDEGCARVKLCTAAFLREHARAAGSRWNAHARCPAGCASRLPVQPTPSPRGAL